MPAIPSKTNFTSRDILEGFMKSVFTIATALILSSTVTVVQAADPSGSHESVTPVVVQDIPNISGKTLTSVVVDYPPGASSYPHRHAASALVYAYVLSGTIRSQVDTDEPRIYRAGE